MAARAAEAGVGAAQLLGHVGAELGEAGDMDLVDRQFGEWIVRGFVAAPLERRVDDHRLGHPRTAVEMADREILFFRAEFVGEQAVVPIDLTRDGLGVRIEEEFRAVETVAVGGIVGAVNAVTIELTRLEIGQENVPDLIGLFTQGDADGLVLGFHAVEEAEFDVRGVRAEEGEVHAVVHPRCAKGIRITEPGFQGIHKTMERKAGMSAGADCLTNTYPAAEWAGPVCGKPRRVILHPLQVPSGAIDSCPF